MKTQIMYLYAIAVVIILSGCGGTAINKNQYMLDIKQTNTAKQLKPSDAVLEVRAFTIDSEFSGRQIVYRKDQFRYVPDYYNEFFIPPATMVTHATKNWLTEAGLFSRILDPGSGIVSRYVLDGSIVSCYADIRAKTAPMAVLKVRIFLTRTDRGTESLAWSKTYEMKEPMKNTQAESFISAMSRCMQEFLETLRKDLQTQQL